MFVCCECCVLSGRGLGDALITRPEESYRLWCVVVCGLEASRMRRPWPALGRSATGGGGVNRQRGWLGSLAGIVLIFDRAAVYIFDVTSREALGPTHFSQRYSSWNVKLINLMNRFKVPGSSPKIYRASLWCDARRQLCPWFTIRSTLHIVSDAADRE